MGKEKKDQTDLVQIPELLPIDEYKVMTPSQLLARKVAIKQIQKAVMKKDTHYGIITGTEKPTLYKAGADELNCLFNIGKENPVVEDLSSDDEIRYRVTVRLFSRISGKFLGSGIGECSSNEEKYKWRKPVCDGEFDDTPVDRRREKWTKGEWDNKAKKNIGKKIKQIRTNPSDIANTILKMSDKRGYVHGTIAVLGISDLFEQDLEDLEENTREHILAEDRAKGGKPVVTQPEQKETPQTNDGDTQETDTKTTPESVSNEVKFANKSQLDMIRKLCQEKGLTSLAAVEHFGGISVETLPAGMVNDVLGYIREYQKPATKGK